MNKTRRLRSATVTSIDGILVARKHTAYAVIRPEKNAAMVFHKGK